MFCMFYLFHSCSFSLPTFYKLSYKPLIRERIQSCQFFTLIVRARVKEYLSYRAKYQYTLWILKVMIVIYVLNPARFLVRELKSPLIFFRKSTALPFASKKFFILRTKNVYAFQKFTFSRKQWHSRATHRGSQVHRVNTFKTEWRQIVDRARWEVTAGGRLGAACFSTLYHLDETESKVFAEEIIQPDSRPLLQVW